MDIVCQEVSFTYSGIGSEPKTILNNISLVIPGGEITAIIGKTGSGKTTLTKLFNGLELPTQGRVVVGDFNVSKNAKEDELFALKKEVGMVFQFPEMQLFEKTVLDDVMFGPLNFGLTTEQAQKSAMEAIRKVGLPEDIISRSPLQLSGGQKRRVAIAGVLASNPKLLVLDEPTAGLDYQAKKEILELFQSLNQNEGITIVMVSHDMEEVSQIANFVVVLKDGQVALSGSSRDVFYNPFIEAMSVIKPEVVSLFETIVSQNKISLPDNFKKPVTFFELVSCLKLWQQGGSNE